jgi:T5SS/PEP-CTERM-associated repeat protein
MRTIPPLHVFRAHARRSPQPERYPDFAGRSAGVLTAILFLGVLLISPAPGFAQVVAIFGGAGNWSSANWVCSLGGVTYACSDPNGPGVTANIGTNYLGPLNGSVVLNVPVNLPDGIVLGQAGGTGTLFVNSPANTLTAGTLEIGFQGTGSGTLNIQSGGVVANSFGIIGDQTGSSGFLNVSGNGSQYNNSSLLFVGNAGAGTMNITNLGLVTSNFAAVGVAAGGPLSIATVGGGSTWNVTNQLVVGANGNGQLKINTGAVVNDSCPGCSASVLGYSAGSTGTATVSGPNSAWNSTGSTGQLVVGLAGNGNLQVLNGAVVNDTCASCSAAVLGANAGITGTVRVSGPGSTWNNTGSGFLNVGYQGNGSLMIDTGGRVNAGEVVVGTFSQGNLNISSGGTLIDTGAIVGAGAGSNGNVLVNAGIWTNTGLLVIGGNGKGTVTLEHGGELNNGGLIIGTNGTLIDDPSTIDVNGDFTLDPGGVVQLDIAGTTPDLISQLNISGFGSFQGTIDLDFIDGFAPAAGDSFNLINVLGGGNFSQANFEVSGLEPGFQFGDNFSDGELTVVADTNGIATPEPGFWWPVAIASVVLSLAALRKKQRNRVLIAKISAAQFQTN